MKIKKLDEGLSEILQYIIDNEPTIELEVSNVHKDYKLSAKTCADTSILRSFGFKEIPRHIVWHWPFLVEDWKDMS